MPSVDLAMTPDSITPFPDERANLKGSMRWTSDQSTQLCELFDAIVEHGPDSAEASAARDAFRKGCAGNSKGYTDGLRLISNMAEESIDDESQVEGVGMALDIPEGVAVASDVEIRSFLGIFQEQLQGIDKERLVQIQAALVTIIERGGRNDQNHLVLSLDSECVGFPEINVNYVSAKMLILVCVAANDSLNIIVPYDKSKDEYVLIKDIRSNLKEAVAALLPDQEWRVASKAMNFRSISLSDYMNRVAAKAV